MSKTIFLPIKPNYANSIANGDKKWEFRKKVPKDSVDNIVVYSSSPEKKILGLVEVLGCVSGTVKDVWNETSSYRGVTKREYDEYFSASKQANAFKLGKFFPLDGVDHFKYIKSVPQSFCYCSQDFQKYLYENISKNQRRFLVTGVHGVGKSTLINSLDVNIVKYSVSDLMSKHELFNDEFYERQYEFATLFRRVNQSNSYIIDGHLVVRGDSESFYHVPYEVVLSLGITDIVLLVGEPSVIFDRDSRKKLTLSEISTMQAMEIDAAKHICSVYKINLHVFSSKVAARCFLDSSFS